MRTRLEIDTEFAHREELNAHRSFFLVGIGGASMSALALMLKARGHAVSGSDSTASPVTAELMAEGVPIRIGHGADGIKRGDAIVLTDAIDLKTSPEVARARELGCPLYRRSQVLGWLLQGRKVLAVTGTHGKTTTTGLAAFAMIEAGLDPLCVEGANIPQWGGPVREGEGEWAVIEACEAYDSLRDFDPTVVILTNLELDHEDFYEGGWPQLRDTVLAFVNRAEVLFYCADDPGACEVAQLTQTPCQGYRDQDLDLTIMGRTNRLNASGALAAVLWAGADETQAREGLRKFTGAERRLQVIRSGDIEVIDDYAHHPTEITASIRALRDRYPGRRLIVAFQPHLYSRTAAHLPEFAAALNEADVVVLTDIYPAREEPIPGVSSARIVEKVNVPCRYVPSRHLLPAEVAKLAQAGDVVVGMGAGTIGEFAAAFCSELDRRARPAKRVAVLFGGDSAEREVSILSGRCIVAALRAKGYDAFLFDATESLLSVGSVNELTGPDRPDVAFLAVHGTNAEDGALQGLCELLHLPYTGSDIQASAIAMDKDRTKQILAHHGIPVPCGVVVRRPDEAPDWAPPLVVKPNEQGSTVGVTFVREQDELRRAIARALQFDDAAIVEEFIEGVEISVPVLGDRALPPVEIVPASGTYDFDAKYTPGATLEVCPARLPEATLKRAEEIALAAHRALRCSGATRTDMIVHKGQPVVLEVNTLPGMTGTSLLPNSAAAAGLSFEDLCVWMVEDALERATAGHGT